MKDVLKIRTLAVPFLTKKRIQEPGKEQIFTTLEPLITNCITGIRASTDNQIRPDVFGKAYDLAGGTKIEISSRNADLAASEVGVDPALEITYTDSEFSVLLEFGAQQFGITFLNTPGFFWTQQYSDMVQREEKFVTAILNVANTQLQNKDQSGPTT